MNAIEIIDVIGTFVFALSGVMVAVEHKFDFFGTIILAFVTAVGGGTLRDVLIGSTPVSWMGSEILIYVIFATIPMAYLFLNFLKKLRRTMFIFDTIGIGLFTILGLEKSVEIGLSPVIAVMMGVVSAVFGGVIRDVLSNEIPLIFRKEIYAFACFAGAITYLIMEQFISMQEVNMLISILTVILIRGFAIHYKWSIPFTPIANKS
ncbi:MAG: trimeric intracellular cation channel family protein [Crocinitomicaceae bacterium]|nr:trimeric intracellular cation channel family protein [Crocinitomicaceae bacterium]